ncbi:NAD(P)H-binding protein [Microbacterium sp. HD4P20]|uniref:NmrA family NAD(P)-binding protein n=1 Tax=Microbacterium sp. HD4P20 TaxID=2864874 RepID=UPI001C63DF26|nr:NAD(P)H-binding protein [Microbacterium sp. HD4P20]MCP2635802.1 NAD(P)H-binding protein [Microbacterium sp. HD4P20]
MYIVMGGTGHVGSAAADALLRRGEEVTIVTRSTESASSWQAKGASIAEADINDVDGLRDVFRMGRRALLLNPPADPSEDTDAVERRTVDNILAALDGCGLEKVVAVSTYGAAPGDRIGDLGTLWRLENGLAQQGIPAAVNRGAYYMSNWDGFIAAARESGSLATMLPTDLKMPMVAPADVGEAAAQRLVSDVDDVGIEYVEGPQRYTAADVAGVLAAQLQRDVRLEVVAPDHLEATFAAFGFSPAAASSYAGMTRRTISTVELPDAPRRGTTTLEQYVKSVL